MKPACPLRAFDFILLIVRQDCHIKHILGKMQCSMIYERQIYSISVCVDKDGILRYRVIYDGYTPDDDDYDFEAVTTTVNTIARAT